MNCVLIGYRGTGKSTIGRLLAAELGFAYVCLDDEIVARAGSSIPEIVRRSSWDHFRDLESAVVEDAAERDRQVIDTGGGVVTRQRNVESLRRTGVLFLLEAAVDDIIQRIGGDAGRPSLTGTKSITDEVVEVLAAREPLYRAAAHHRIDTSACTPQEAARRIAEVFGEAAGATGR
jgi:shikimate kinase